MGVCKQLNNPGTRWGTRCEYVSRRAIHRRWFDRHGCAQKHITGPHQRSARCVELRRRASGHYGGAAAPVRRRGTRLHAPRDRQSGAYPARPGGHGGAVEEHRWSARLPVQRVVVGVRAGHVPGAERALRVDGAQSNRRAVFAHGWLRASPCAPRSSTASTTILFGRQPVSTYDDLVKDWRANGGDTIRPSTKKPSSRHKSVSG